METVYQAEQGVIETMHRTREKIHSICRSHLNRPVRIESMDGEVFEGCLINLDHRYIYLQPAMNAPNCAPVQMMRQPFPGLYYPPFNPYASTILPLVLFNLLTISLL